MLQSLSDDTSLGIDNLDGIFLKIAAGLLPNQYTIFLIDVYSVEPFWSFRKSLKHLSLKMEKQV